MGAAEPTLDVGDGAGDEPKDTCGGGGGGGDEDDERVCCDEANRFAVVLDGNVVAGADCNPVRDTGKCDDDDGDDSESICNALVPNIDDV